MREIIVYETGADQKSIEKFIDLPSSEQANKAAWVLKLVEELDRVPTQYFKNWSTLMIFGGVALVKVQIFSDLFDSLMVRLWLYWYTPFKRRRKKHPRQISGLLKIGIMTISRIENHAEDIKLSTLENFANALGKELYLKVA